MVGLSSPSSPSFARALQGYFRSGWAFLIPYLAAYLLYWWLRWPVNPALSPASAPGVPCLLHVYWALHAVNVGLGLLVLGTWLRERWAGRGATGCGQGKSPAPDGNPGSLAHTLARIAPWLLLGLVFYLPGVYWEFPADPWQHFGRINEWSMLQAVDEHTFPGKLGYFLVYSIVGRITPPLRQCSSIDLLCTGACLLLCWQYYRLARSAGLGERAALLFVVLQAVLLGNNIFSFYRYYGIAATVLAQIGALALTRIGLEMVRGVWQPANPGGIPEAATPPPGRGRRAGALPPFPQLRRAALPMVLLVVLTGSNHPQGIGIAALGLGAVACWRLVSWRRSLAWWLVGIVLAVNMAAALWWPRNPALDRSLRPAGWLTSWYGYNVFSMAADAGAGDRTRWIIGLFGLLNLGAGVALVRRNHVVGWITVVPLVALCLPAVIIPLANVLAMRYAEAGILTIPRMLLAIPAGLAIVALVESLVARPDSAETNAGAEAGAPNDHRSAVATAPGRTTVAPPLPGSGLTPAGGFGFVVFGLAALVLVPARGPYFNRFWNALAVTPDDLRLRPVLAAAAGLPATDAATNGAYFPARVNATGILTTPGIGYALQSAGVAWIPSAGKRVSRPPAETTDAALEDLRHVDPRQVRPFSCQAGRALFTPASLGAFLSGHWLFDEVALVHATQPELLKPPGQPPLPRRPPELWLDWALARGGRYAVDRMAGRETITIPDARERLILRPVLRTLDGNGWRVALRVIGPGSFRRDFEVRRRPVALGGEQRIYADFPLPLPGPGRYEITLTGDAAWPNQTCEDVHRLEVTARSGASLP